jgi:CRP/FNR family transcriptional regulator
MMDTNSILEQFSFYRQAEKSVKAIYAEAAKGFSLSEGTVFYREGETIGGVALVGRGDIRVFKSGESGREVTLYHVRGAEACFVNMMCVYLQRPALANAQVEASTEAVILRPEVFREGVRSDDALREFVFASTAQRMVDVISLIDEIAFRRMDARLEDLLLQRFSRQQTIATTHELIASELGSAREVISRLLKDLEQRGAIALGRGHIELRDRTKLGGPVEGVETKPSSPRD